MPSSNGAPSSCGDNIPKDQHESIGRWISILHREARITIGNRLRQYDIGGGQHHILMALYHNDGIIQDEIARLVCIDKANVGRAVRKMEDKGFLVREQDVNDKRAHRIHLTEKGRSVENTLREILTDWTAVLATGFTPEEKETAIRLLKQMYGNALEHRKQREGERK